MAIKSLAEWNKKSLGTKIREKATGLFNDNRGMSVGDIYPVILTIVLAAILIALALYIFAGIQTGVAINVGSFTNETGAFVNNTGYQIANSSACGFNAVSVTTISAANATTAIFSVPSANYSVSSRGIIKNSTDAVYDSFLGVNVSGTFKFGGSSCTALTTITGQFVNFLPWIGIILLIVAAAIVLGILINNLVGGKSRV